MNPVGERIRGKRLSNGLTQKQLGERCGMADSAIRRYESGRGNPTVETLQRIASALGTTVGFLLDGRHRLGDMVKKWESNKEGHLDINIDSDLLELLRILAEEDGVSLDDEVEIILKEYTENEVERRTGQPPQD